MLRLFIQYHQHYSYDNVVNIAEQIVAALIVSLMVCLLVRGLFDTRQRVLKFQQEVSNCMQCDLSDTLIILRMKQISKIL
jgi:hypothetical protein